MLFSVTAVFKQQYYSRISKKLMDSSSSPKVYRSLLSKTSVTKYLALLHYFIKIKSISNFKEKIDLSNNFLAKQCTLVNNASEIPATLDIKKRKHLLTFGSYLH